jgi:hypothetical protein
VTFPDGYPREIAASQLVIDSQVVEIRNQPPFDSFDWDLSGYQETGSHEIKILVEDVLGLQGSATGMPITIEVITPEGSSTSFQPDLDMLLPIGGGVTAFLLISMLVITINRRRRAQTPATTGDTNRRTPPSRSFGLRRSSDQTMVEATLIPVDPNNPTISLIGMDLVLGRDASISAAHLDDLSVNAVHARMIRLASGDYLIRDQGSVAGTWVNYHQVPERGKILQHGDMIHLGRIEYQFQLRNPPLESRIHVESIQAPISETNEENRGVEETTT